MILYIVMLVCVLPAVDAPNWCFIWARIGLILECLDLILEIIKKMLE